ncbi:MAG: PAS domain-containing protein [Acidobacteria bacterium]|nr:PAS domain-containing protein [Acidobacteriota bacterium]
MTTEFGPGKEPDRASASLSRAGQSNVLVRALYGALMGTLPMLVSVLMEPDHRSPYVLAFPAVVLSAWIWGLPSAVACAAVAGALIEHFIFATHQVNLAPDASGWAWRECMFLIGSIMVGALTRTAAQQRQQIVTAALEQKLALAEAERISALEREQSAELRLENEVRAQMALDGANAGAFDWDIVTNTSKWSAGFYRLHGLEPGGPANYDIWKSRLHPDDVDRCEAEVMKAVQEVGSFFAEYRVLTPDGDVRWIACQGITHAGPDGRAVSMNGYCGDVTRRKLADMALLQNEKLAVAGRLSASIAHEVNNPLEAAINLLYLLRDGVDGEEYTGYLDEAMQQLERVAQITNQTLKFSRTPTRSSHCKLSDLVEGTLRLIRPKLHLAKIDLNVEARGESLFYCSPSEIQQVLTNIINNAAEAITSPGRIRIRISDSLDWRTRSIRGVRVSVADTGSGMSAYTLRKMQEPFFTTKQGTGTGLGMWVVRELLDKHQATMSISTSSHSEHHGTVMSLFFPLDLRTDRE